MTVFVTDAMLFLLLTIVVAFIVYAAGHEHLRAPWREVFRQPLALAAAAVLTLFVAVGVLDSIRTCVTEPDQSSSDGSCPGQVLTLIDQWLGHLRLNEEKTYSAPFALYSFSKESVEVGGETVRDYVRLEHGGAHLAGAEERVGDVARTALAAGLPALVGWLVLVVAVIAIHPANRGSVGDVIRRTASGRTAIPWRVLIGTGGVLVAGVAAVLALSADYHVFGTDKVGQDVLFQAIKSIRTGLVIGTLTTLVMLPFALALGLAAGYFGGRVDDVIQYLYTTLASIPGVLLIAAAVLMLQVYMSNNAEEFTSLAKRADMRLLFLCLILGITSWTSLCRLLRAEALKLREADYVHAAHAFGVSNLTIMHRHLLPNVMHIVLITVVIDFSGLVLAEAVLSYINIGVDPSMNSWGNMINNARLELAREPVVWWSLAAAFVFMFMLVLAANLFADAVRDAFDPRLRQSAA